MRSVIVPAVLAAMVSLPEQSPATHRLEATPQTVAYGWYDAAGAPVLRIASGDIIDVDTLLTNTPVGLQRAGVTEDRIQPSLKAIVEAYPQGNPKRGPGGHILTGPVFVEGAEPGDALEVKILSIDLAIDYGYNGCSGFLRENCPQGQNNTKIIPLDRGTMTATFAPGIVIPLHPFFGSMGVAPPPEQGRVSSNPPGPHAGNLDNRSLDQTAIETSLRGRLQLTVKKGMTLKWPRAETPTAYIAMATDEDLTKATRTAIQEMVDFLGVEKKLDRLAAYQLTSIAGNVAITQLVDGKVGVHVTMPKEIFK
jgi:acetamidase/formamidase